jgi:hypothetical protein
MTDMDSVECTYCSDALAGGYLIQGSKNPHENTTRGTIDPLVSPGP